MSLLFRDQPADGESRPLSARTFLVRLLPPVILVPLILGWLRLEGEKAGLYSTNVGVALMVILTIGLLSLLVLLTARALHRVDTERSVINQALRTSEERARLVIDSAYDAFIAMDANGVIIDWNLQAEKTFGFAGSQAIGRKLSDTIIPEPYRFRHQASLEHFLKTGEGPLLWRRVQITALRADGSEFPVELAISPVRWADTWVFNAFVHDISDWKTTDATQAIGEPVQSGNSGLRILLVEDHLSTRSSLGRLLESWGHSVAEAETLAQARQVLKAGSIDLLLTDVQLPDGLGSDLMKEVRETSPNLPGIALTGFDTAGHVNESFQAGFLLHFTKPIATEKLKSAIEEIAKARQRTGEGQRE
jgi:PAS domain S-box-containing protein